MLLLTLSPVSGQMPRRSSGRPMHRALLILSFPGPSGNTLSLWSAPSTHFSDSTLSWRFVLFRSPALFWLSLHMPSGSSLSSWSKCRTCQDSVHLRSLLRWSQVALGVMQMWTPQSAPNRDLSPELQTHRPTCRCYMFTWIGAGDLHLPRLIVPLQTRLPVVFPILTNDESILRLLKPKSSEPPWCLPFSLASSSHRSSSSLSAISRNHPGCDHSLLLSRCSKPP